MCERGGEKEKEDGHVLRALARLKTTLYRELLAPDHTYMV